MEGRGQTSFVVCFFFFSLLFLFWWLRHVVVLVSGWLESLAACRRVSCVGRDRCVREGEVEASRAVTVVIVGAGLFQRCREMRVGTLLLFVVVGALGPLRCGCRGRDKAPARAFLVGLLIFTYGRAWVDATTVLLYVCVDGCNVGCEELDHLLVCFCLVIVSAAVGMGRVQQTF